ncbi:hypothetical protein [Bdellovibrio sp. HCB337]|uniref:hypothetical protein n=1 Tax=Bdellovibrio sp. HCB337 TaxID=3394358 RepID=UPI0039A40317
MIGALKTLTVMMAAFIALQAQAQNKEAPPMEPPYTNDNEFDAVLGEDPMATNQAIPVSPGIAPTPAPVAQPKKQVPVQQAPTQQADTTPSHYEPVWSQPSYKKGEPLDKGVKLIKHPDAKKGLMRIEQDGTYVYKVKTSPKSQTGIIRFGLMQPPNIVSADGTTTFKDMYTADDIFTLLVDYEWQPFSKYGKLGVQLGGGFSMTSGHGRFLDGTEALESYDFVTLPLNAGVIYRLEYFKRQWVAPYISAGGSYIAVAEIRDDGKNNFTGTPAAYGAGGLMFNITALDKQMAFNLDAEYGVGNLWLVGEYRYQKSFSEDLDFTGGIMSLGISADF